MLKKLIYICILASVSIALVQCDKKDELKGCCEKGAQLKCIMNELPVTGDSIAARYSLSNRHLYLYFRNKDTTATALISIYYPLSNLDKPLINKDQFGFGTAVSTFQKQPYGITNGNIKMEVSLNAPDSTICGEFFYADKDKNFYVNQGWFSNIAVKTTL
jgi:hypothetical protein